MSLVSAFLFSATISSLVNIILSQIRTYDFRYFRLGVLVLFLSLSLIYIEHFIEYGGFACDWPHTIFMSATSYLLIGPALNLIIRSVFNRPIRRRWQLTEYIPALLYFISMIPFYVLTGAQKCQYLTNYVHLQGFGSIKHWILVVAVFIQVIVYLIIWVREIHKYNTQVRHSSSSAIIEFMPWVIGLLAVIMAFVMVVVITWAARHFFHDYYYQLDQMESIALSLIPYVFTFLLFCLPTNPFPEITDSHPKREVEQSIDNEQKTALTNLMIDQQIFLNPDLSLEDVATTMNISRHQLSNLLSKGLHKNFYDFVNEHRINHACKLMRSEMIQTYSLSGIAHESGFSNYVSFYRVFKRTMKQSPSDYLSELK